MNYLLIIVILLICGGAYYEHSVYVQQTTADQLQIDDLKSKVDNLTTVNKKLSDDLVRAVEKAASAPAETPAAAVAPTPPPTPLTNAPTSNPPAAITAAPHNITTIDGRTFTNYRILNLESDGITISSDSGITKVKFNIMTPEQQKVFNYDPTAKSEAPAPTPAPAAQ